MAVKRSSSAPQRRTPPWSFFIGMITIGIIAPIPIALGLWAVRQLLLPPQAEACQSVWTNDPPALRLQCADTIASEAQASNLQRAIHLADSIPSDDPLRQQADRRIEEWSTQLLQVAEAAFQSGDLEGAIQIIESIPSQATAYASVKERTRQWKTIWDKAQAIYHDVEGEIDAQRWNAALDKARRLLTIGNEYWATARYEELMQQVQFPTKGQSKAKAGKPENGGVKLTPVSDVMADYRKERAKKDQAYLQKAQSLASSGRVEDLQSAISEAEMVFSDGPQYKEAQRLIQSWRRQVDVAEDREYLERATKLAQQGDVYSLQSAIDQAGWISRDRPLYQEADAQIETWKRQMMQLQNRPKPTSQIQLSPPDTTPLDAHGDEDYSRDRP